MSGDAFVTRQEFDGLANRVAWLDEHGTRGVGALQIQVNELSKDIAKVEAGQENHLRQHTAEAQERTTNRRWLVASVLVPTLCVLVSAAATISVVLVR